MAQQRPDHCTHPIVAFIARGDEDFEEDDDPHALLRLSLDAIARLYEAEYGPSDRPHRFFTYVLHPSQLARSGDPVIAFFRGILAEANQSNCGFNAGPVFRCI